MKIDYFNTADFHSALQTFFKNLNIPVNYLAEEPVRPQEILSDTYKPENPAFQLMDDVYFLGMVDDAAFDGHDSPNPKKIKTDYDGILIFGVTLHPRDHGLLPTRSQLAGITRAFNREYHYTPVVVVFKYDNHIAFANAERMKYKQEWREGEKAGKVSLLRDIDPVHLHPGHRQILSELAISRSGKKAVNSFADLYSYWQTVFNVELLNKRFYRRIQQWFFWSAQMVHFPHGGVDDEDLRNRTALIRLLTRIMFCWFAREKGLIPDALFDAKTAIRVLRQFDPDSEMEGNYYLAFLQNLFFPTLSVPLDQREFRNGRRYRGTNKHYMKHNVFRHEACFKDADDLGRLFADIPFLNGGLFECLDTGTCKKDEVRVDGFSDVAKNQPIVPDILFFGSNIKADLSDAYDSPRKSEVMVDGLFHILNAYKFTVTENTPIEEEVALDPELLGRIFENLLAEYNPETAKTARKLTGSFYTPRNIVDYMVDSSLKACLQKILTDQCNMPAEDAGIGLDILFSYSEKAHPFTESEQLSLVDGIHNIRILDPACGSGAFPMGMLHKLVYVLEKLDHGHERWKQRIIDETPAEMREETREILNRNSADYNWKLGLIQRCIYGVDIQPIAVQIAKLRCFLSLLVDFEVHEKEENKGVPSLPNLDFKFVAADTLIRPPGAQRAGELIGLVDPFFEAFSKAAEDYFFIRDPADKRKLRARIERMIDEKIAENERALSGHRGDSYADEKIRNAIAARNKAAIAQTEREIELWESYRNIFAFRNQYVRFFDTRYFFPEAKAGFDIVIGNPPYVRQELLRPVKAQLKESFGSFFASTADLYTYFYARGLDLLRQRGVLCYIAPNKFMRAGYGRNTRKLLATQATPRIVIDFGDLPIFEATTYPSIVMVEKVIPGDADEARAAVFSEDSQIEQVEETLDAIGFPMPVAALKENGWTLERPEVLALMEKLRKRGTPLGEYVLGRFYRGVLTGLNEAFVIDEATRQRLIEEDPHSADIIKPWLRGRDIRKWKANWAGLYVIAMASSRSHAWPWSKASDEIQALEIFANEYPAVHAHLRQWKNRLHRRDDQGKYWWELRACAYYAEFERPKIVYPDIAQQQKFTWDESNTYLGNTAYIIPTDEIWLVGLLNSALIWWFYLNISSMIRGGFVRFIAQYMGQLPIPNASSEEKTAIAELVQSILADPKSLDVPRLESEINDLVFNLYSLTDTERELVLSASSPATVAE